VSRHRPARGRAMMAPVVVSTFALLALAGCETSPAMSRQSSHPTGETTTESSALEETPAPDTGAATDRQDAGDRSAGCSQAFADEYFALDLGAMYTPGSAQPGGDDSTEIFDAAVGLEDPCAWFAEVPAGEAGQTIRDVILVMPGDQSRFPTIERQMEAAGFTFEAQHRDSVVFSHEEEPQRYAFVARTDAVFLSDRQTVIEKHFGIPFIELVLGSW